MSNKWQKVSIICILAIVGVVLVNIFWLYPKFRFIVTSDPVMPSPEQRELIQHFGYPDTFMLSMQKQNRFEIWTYYNMERNFVFLDGEFIEEQSVSNLSEDFGFPDFRPTQFENNINLAQANKILGPPTAQGEVIPELMKNTTIYDYWDQVKVGVKDKEVIYVQTQPIFIPERFRVNKK